MEANLFFLDDLFPACIRLGNITLAILFKYVG